MALLVNAIVSFVAHLSLDFSLILYFISVVWKHMK